VRAGWALAHLYRRLRDKDIDPSSDVPRLAELIIAPEPEVRAGITDALAEMQRAAARPILLRQLDDQSPIARQRAARGLVGFAHAGDLLRLWKALADSDERVVAAAALAIAMLAEQGIVPELAIEALTRELDRLTRPAAVIALVDRGLIHAAFVPFFAQLGDRLEQSGKPQLACLAALGHDRAAAKLDRVLRCGGPAIPDVERHRLEARALGEADPRRVAPMLPTLLAIPMTDWRVRAQVAGALARYTDPAAERRLLQLTDDRDPSVIASVAEALAARNVAATGAALVRLLPERVPTPFTPEHVDSLLSVFAAVRVLKPPGVGARLRPFLDGTPAAIALAARDTLEVLGDKAIARPATPRGAFDEMGWPDGAVIVRLETERGAIRIDVRADRAPRNARNFVGLVKQGFYDGLGFHRVVPGFVAQAGDPRGDGSGGAQHLVACEPSAAQYVEGTVGMALSGQDTGSSQFFIALAPAPHLEGRYTALGQVVEGMEVARALQPGDKIKSARIEAVHVP
jgi:cyclophilin family peptidyl-prolyl cis-trans isomerase/HEAT repeat protein